MLVPIQCMSCGCAIGDKEDLFRHMVGEMSLPIHRFQDDRPPTIPGQAEPIVDPESTGRDAIFELLGIYHDCCRTHLISAMIFTDYY
jgi:DNA-directed RNA polymerase subunit N (RpoN/RPB10)